MKVFNSFENGIIFPIMSKKCIIIGHGFGSGIVTGSTMAFKKESGSVINHLGSATLIEA